MSRKRRRSGKKRQAAAMAEARLEGEAGRLGRVTAKQQKAIGLILSGITLAEVGKRVGVCRSTVYNWTHRNERFMAALSSWRADMKKAARARLLGLSGAGVLAIAGALTKGDAKVAIAVFKGMGVFEEGKEEEREDVPILIPDGEGWGKVRVIRRRKVDRGETAMKDEK